MAQYMGHQCRRHQPSGSRPGPHPACCSAGPKGGQRGAHRDARPAVLAESHQPGHRRDTMRLRTQAEAPSPKCEARRISTRPDTKSSQQRASVLVIVLWIAFGLVSLALYFANSMSFELRASDNRVCAIAADQAIDGAVRYLNYL